MAAARKKAGAGTQADVAQELCDAKLIPAPRHQTLSEWEKGEREPNYEQLTWLRERYGFDWEWFFSGEDLAKELAAYRRIARIVMETETPTRPPGSPERTADGLQEALPDGGGGGANQEGAS